VSGVQTCLVPAGHAWDAERLVERCLDDIGSHESESETGTTIEKAIVVAVTRSQEGNTLHNQKQ